MAEKHRGHTRKKQINYVQDKIKKKFKKFCKKKELQNIVKHCAHLCKSRWL